VLVLSLKPAITLTGTHEDERAVLYKTKSLDGTKPNTNPKTKIRTNPNPNTNPNPKVTQILTLISFMLFQAPSPNLQSSPLTLTLKTNDISHSYDLK